MAGRYPCQTKPSTSVSSTRDSDPASSNRHSSTRSATSENRAKFVPHPSHVAPSGYAAPGQVCIRLLKSERTKRLRLASLVSLVILSYPDRDVGRGSASRRGGVAWAWRWNPAPSAAPRALCGRLMRLLVVVTSWFRQAARGRYRSVGACPSGRWPVRPGRRAGEGALRRLGAGRAVRFRVEPVFDRSHTVASLVITAVAS